MILFFIASSSSSYTTLSQLPGLANAPPTGPEQPDTDPTALQPGKSSNTAPKAATSPNKPVSGLVPQSAPGERANATLVSLARNSDVWEIALSIRQVEDRFNRKFNYDWVFLNDKPFDERFKTVTTSLVSGKTHYGEIPQEHWSFPPFIDQKKAEAVREDMRERKVIYGDSISYRHMCRFESGFFFQHELMQKYDYYWRVEPSIQLFCDVDFDPFKYMQDHGKKYSFVISLYEFVETIPTLWNSIRSFMKQYPQHIADNNSMGFISDDNGATYNNCHFVSSARAVFLSWPFFFFLVRAYACG